MNEHQIEFGSRRGVPRLLDLLAKYNFPATFNCAGLALELAPYWTERIVKAGHELSCGSLRWIDYMGVEPAVEEMHVKQAMEVFEGFDEVPKGESGLYECSYTLTSTRTHSHFMVYCTGHQCVHSNHHHHCDA